LELWNIGTLEHWNSGTFEPVPSSPSGKKIGFGSSHLLTFIPYGEILCTVFISYCPSSPMGKKIGFGSSHLLTFIPYGEIKYISNYHEPLSSE